MARRASGRAAPRRTRTGAASRQNEVTRALSAAAKALKSLKVRFALVGGLAVGARAEPRFTADVDLAVAVRDDAEAERVVLRLRESGWEVRMLIEQRAVGRLGTARFQLPGLFPDLRVDLLFSTAGIEGEVVDSAAQTKLPGGITVPTATVGHLIALKCLSESPRRLQDRLDLQSLIAVADGRELARARRALGSIAARGLSRGKNLERVLARYLK